MKKFTKICLWSCVICLLVGILLMAVSWALGFRVFRPYSKGEWELTERNETIDGDIKNLRLDVKAGSIIVEEGDFFAITAATDGNHFKSTVENGTWTIEEAEEHEKGSSIGGLYVDDDGVYLKSALGAVHVTIPKDAHFEHVEIEVQAGAVEIEKLSCETMEIEVQAGAVDFSADVDEKLSVECQAGGVSGYLDGKEEDFDLEVECNVGSITAGNYEYGGFVVGSDRINTEAHKKMVLSCDIGSIDICFEK